MRQFRFLALSIAVASSASAFAQARKPVATPVATPPVARKAGDAQSPTSSVVGVSLAAARQVFGSADRDKSGGVSVAEAAAAGLGPRDIAAGDRDADGVLGADEFIAAYHGSLVRLGRAVEQDLADESTRVAEVAAKKHLRDGDRPAAEAPRAPRVAPDDAKAELERKVEIATRNAAAEVQRPRVAKAPEDVGDAALDEKAQQAEQELERRLETSKATDEQAAAARERLQQRIEAAKQGGEPAAPAATPTPAPAVTPVAGVDAPVAPGLDKKTFEEQAAAARAALQQRLAGNGATPDQIQAALANLERRIGEQRAALERNDGGAPAPAPAVAPAVGIDAPVAPSLDTKTFEEQAAAARAALQQRLASNGATPDQIQAALANLERRIGEQRAALERNDGGAPAPAPAVAPAVGVDTPIAPGLDPKTFEEQAAAARAALQQRLASNGATPDQIQAALANLERRIGEQRAALERNDGGAPAPAPAVAPAVGIDAPVAPGLDTKTFEEQAAAARAALQQRLASNGATPDQIQAALANLERRIGEQRAALERNDGGAPAPAAAPQPAPTPTRPEAKPDSAPPQPARPGVKRSGART